jgi:hypothetical protein
VLTALDKNRSEPCPMLVKCCRVQTEEHTEGKVEQARQRLDGALVGLSGALVLGLVDLVASSGQSTRRTVGDAVVSGNIALGLLLVGLLGCLSRVALDGLGDVVGGVLDRVDGLADDAVVGVVGVGGRHFDVWGWLVWFESGGRL